MKQLLTTAAILAALSSPAFAVGDSIVGNSGVANQGTIQHSTINNGSVGSGGQFTVCVGLCVGVKVG